MATVSLFTPPTWPSWLHVNTLYNRLVFFLGLIPGPKSYFLDFANLFVTTCGTSFFSQCLPPQSVNLLFSSTAMHWLRDRPCDVTGALHHTMITVPEEKKKFQNQAAKDWETILLARAKELASGKYTFFGFVSAWFWHTRVFQICHGIAREEIRTLNQAGLATPL